MDPFRWLTSICCLLGKPGEDRSLSRDIDATLHRSPRRVTAYVANDVTQYVMVGYSSGGSGGRWDAGSRLLERLRFRSSRRPRSEYFSSALNSSSSAAAFLDQKDFTYYTPNQLSTLRCHSFEIGDGCLLRRTRHQQQSSGSGQKSPTSPVIDVVCDVCHQQISTSSSTSAYYTCQVCGYVSHDRCLSQADNTCPTCLTRQPSTFFKTLSSSHLIPSSSEAVHAISLQPVSAVKSLVDMPSDVTMLTSSYQQQSMSARPDVKLHSRRWSSSTTAMSNTCDDRLTLMELGLTYITERIIALTCPLECPEPVYRSGLRDLFKMLQTKHANNFMIINLSERIEEMHSLSQKVLDFGWPDMLAPPLNRLCSICKSVESWLNVSSQNVVVFHCKTGLSRLAVVVSAFIDYLKLCPDTATTTTAASAGDRKIQSLDYYAMKRFYETKLHSSIMPSQRRYIHYLSGLLAGSIRLNNNPVYLQRIAVLGLRDVDSRTQWNMSSSSSHCQLFVKIYQNLQPIFTSANTHLSIGDSSSTVIVVDTPVQLRCDVLVKCYKIASVAPGRTTTSSMLLQQQRQLMFWCQFHVSTVTPDSTVVFTRKDLDEIGQGHLFTDSVRVEMELSSTPQPTSYNYSSGGSRGLVNSSTSAAAAGIGGQRNVLERCNSYEQFTELLRGNNFFDTVASFQPISVISVDDGTATLPHHEQLLQRQKQQRQEQQQVGDADGHVTNSVGDVVANGSALFSKVDGNLHTTTFHQQQQQQLRVERMLKGEQSEQFVSRLTSTGVAKGMANNGKMAESVPARISPASKTTEELEVQHNELDSVLRNLLTQEMKSISPSTVHQRGTLLSADTFDTQTVTTRRTRELTPTCQQQQQVVVATETTERPTYHRKVAASQSFDCGIAAAADNNKYVTGGEDRGGGMTDDDNCYRSYLSDSEDQLTWLQEQRNRLRQHVRNSAAWRSKTKQEKQLVSELRSAQNALATLRSRAQSESDSLDWQTGSRRTPVDNGRYSTEYSGADDNSRYSRRTSLSSSRQDRCDVQPDLHFESGPDRERPVPVTTRQTTYTFAVGPHRTASLDHGLSSSNYSTLNRSLSPCVPDRTASSHDVMVKSDQTVSETVEKTLVKNQLVEQLNKVSMASLETKTKPFEVIEEEVIALVPIGRGVQNIEPDTTQPNGLFVRSGRMASSLSVPSSLSLVRGASPSATSSAAAAVALGSQSTLNYQQVQTRPFGTTTSSNNLFGSNQTLRHSKSFTSDQQPVLLQQQVIGQQTFERQMLLQQQQLDAQQEFKRRNDIQRQEELRRQDELQRQQELLRQEEIKRLEELQRLEETRRQQEMHRQEELRRNEELQRQQELLRQEELRRREELQKQQEFLRQEEIKRLEELQRLEETRRQQEMLRQEELRRNEELQRQQELLRQEEIKRLEETRRQQEMLRKEELRRNDELQRQEELQRQQELIRQEKLKRHELLEFENQIQQQHLQVQQQALIREEQVSKQVGVMSSVSPLSTQSASSNNCRQTITEVSSVSYQTTNRHLAETGYSLPVDVEMLQNSLSVPEQAAASAGYAAARTISASSADVSEFPSTTPRFVYDTSKMWHRPNVSRDEAINFLKDKPAGSFVIRNSSTFHGSFGLAVKVSQLPANVQPKGGDLKSALVRHFLIETTSKGVRLKGCSNEPTFGSLAALVYQHSITPLALPCKLLLPELNDLKDVDFTLVGSTSRQLVQQEAACNVIYVNSTDVESLTGAVAISKAIEHTFLPGQNPPNTTVVRFKVSAHGITLTDNHRKLFFRRHYPLTSVTYCGLDRQDKRMKTFDVSDTATVTGRLFGFVARKQNSVTENACHLFAEMDSIQPASAIVNFVERMLSEHGHVLA